MPELDKKLTAKGADNLLALTQANNEVRAQIEEAKTDAWRIRQASTAYAAGNKVIVPGKGNFDLLLTCTTAGTTGTDALDYTGLTVGATITDGTVVWEVINRETPQTPTQAPVTSVNSKTGDVVLSYSDVGAEQAGTVATHDANADAHEAAFNKRMQYDTTPTSESTKLLTSGSIYAAMQWRGLFDPIPDISTQDLNNLTSSQYFTCGQNLQNAPNGDTGWFYIQTVRHTYGVEWMYQYAIKFSGSVFFRARTSSEGWQAWKQIDDSANQSLSNLNAAGYKKIRDVIPTGAIFPIAGLPPEGFLLCDGAAISRTAYPELFAAISTTYGAGDGSTTFNVPDFRGYFLRGYKSGVTAELGVAQEDAFKSHKHTTGYDSWATADENSGGSAPMTVTRRNVGDGGTGLTGLATGGLSGDGETRPANFAVNFVIRY